MEIENNVGTTNSQVRENTEKVVFKYPPRGHTLFTETYTLKYDFKRGSQKCRTWHADVTLPISCKHNVKYMWLKPYFFSTCSTFDRISSLEQQEEDPSMFRFMFRVYKKKVDMFPSMRFFCCKIFINGCKKEGCSQFVCMVSFCLNTQ